MRKNGQVSEQTGGKERESGERCWVREEGRGKRLEGGEGDWRGRRREEVDRREGQKINIDFLLSVSSSCACHSPSFEEGTEGRREWLDLHIHREVGKEKRQRREERRGEERGICQLEREKEKQDLHIMLTGTRGRKGRDANTHKKKKRGSEKDKL